MNRSICRWCVLVILLFNYINNVLVRINCVYSFISCLSSLRILMWCGHKERLKMCNTKIWKNNKTRNNKIWIFAVCHVITQKNCVENTGANLVMWFFCIHFFTRLGFQINCKCLFIKTWQQCQWYSTSYLSILQRERRLIWSFNISWRF